MFKTALSRYIAIVCILLSVLFTLTAIERGIFIAALEMVIIIVLAIAIVVPIIYWADKGE